MIRSTAIYDEHPDLNSGYIWRWIDSGFLRPLVRNHAHRALGHLWPDWTLRMVRLLVRCDTVSRGRAAPARFDALRGVASLMDDGVVTDWYVAVDGAEPVACETAEDVAMLCRAGTSALILAVPA